MDFSKPIPSYLLEKRNSIRLILFTAGFALLFINVYAPFGVETWFNISKLELFIFSSLVILTGVLVVVISRIIMYQCGQRGRSISLGHYLLWIAVEIVSMSLFYTLYEIIILKDPRPILDAFKISMQNTSLVLLLPYSTLWLYFSWQDKKMKLDALIEEREELPENRGMVLFRDEKGVMRFSIKNDDLLYLKGADNYVTIYYSVHQKHEKFLLRNTLKNMEESLRPLDVVRCHRSYMVNFQKVKIIEREKMGMRIKLDTAPVLEVPVSKTYVESVFQMFGQNV
ncbi:MAG: LytTR family transcriptional regulator DNA-binding domain-containing protein [Marinilabiliaceae bacterium]|nr:LytTR family transcriptional regulator DNA-binding domain-containing protein [Marinilabiliaceae bacterium]